MLLGFGKEGLAGEGLRLVDAGVLFVKARGSQRIGCVRDPIL